MALSTAQAASLYQNLLGRTPGQDEINYWVSTGKSADQVAADIRYSSEYTNKTAQPTTSSAPSLAYNDINNIYNSRNQQMTGQDYDYWSNYAAQYDADHTKSAIQNAFDYDRSVSHNNAYTAAKDASLNSVWAQLGITGDLAHKYGLDNQYYGYIDDIYNSLNKRDLVPAGAYNYSKLLPTLHTSAQYVKQNWQDDLLRSFNQRYGPTYLDDYFGSDMDDEYITEILTGQKDQAFNTIQNAFKRGQLNNVGLTQAQSDLENQFGAANALVQALGEGIIGKYRQQAGTILGNTQNSLSSVTPGSYFDYGSVDNHLNKLRTDASNNIRNELLAAMGDTKYFTPLKAIKSGGAQQGLTNPLTSGFTPDLLGDMPEDQKRRQDQLVTQGNRVF
jgi:hypothetical protein